MGVYDIFWSAVLAAKITTNKERRLEMSRRIRRMEQKVRELRYRLIRLELERETVLEELERMERLLRIAQRLRDKQEKDSPGLEDGNCKSAECPICQGNTIHYWDEEDQKWRCTVCNQPL